MSGGDGFVLDHLYSVRKHLERPRYSRHYGEICEHSMTTKLRISLPCVN